MDLILINCHCKTSSCYHQTCIAKSIKESDYHINYQGAKLFYSCANKSLGNSVKKFTLAVDIIYSQSRFHTNHF